MNYAEEKVDIERTVYDWAIPDFSELFNELNKRKNIERSSRRNGKEKHIDSSDLEIISQGFIRGQLVRRTSTWQMELRRNGAYLSVGLSCLDCLHENVDEIWTRFDIDIVDFNGEVCHSQGAGVHFCSENITKFTPLSKIVDKADARQNIRCSFWETDAISMNDLQKKWEKLVRMNILNLKLRLYIYHQKPFDEASHIADFQEPVKLCYTDLCHFPFNNILLDAAKNLWESKKGADIIFEVEGEKVLAHKLLVSIQSPVFEMMTSNVTENMPIQVTFTTSKAFKHILKYLYTQDISDLKENSDVGYIASLLDACNHLKIGCLARICLVRLLTNISVENFTETAITIFSKVTVEQSFFKTEVKKFLMENQKELRKSRTFQRRSHEERDLFLKICFEPIQLFRGFSSSTV